MFGWLKRKSTESAVKPVESSEGTDRAYREAWGFSAPQWAAMSPEQRRDFRERVAYATTVKGA